MKLLRPAAMVLLGMVALAAVAPEWWAPAHYATQFREAADAEPSARFPLGTDRLGRDRLSRLVYGTRVSLLLAPAAAILSCTGAALIGGSAAVVGGLIEAAILALADLCLSLPWLFLLLTMRALLPLNVSPQASISLTFLLLGVLGWAGPARVVFATVRKLQCADFILQAHAAGLAPWRVFLRHLTPNLAPVLLAQFCVAVPLYVLAEATLGMLGLGVAEPLPSWGNILRELESGNALGQPWLLVPVILLALVVASFQAIIPSQAGEQDFA
jgi:peptide/nickel transport system permease protein